MALSMIVSLYTVRVVLQALGINDYGIYSAVGGIVSSLTIFTNALSTASQRYFAIEIGKGKTEGLNRVFNSMFLLYLLTGILVLVIAETAGVWFLIHEMKIPIERIDAAFVILQCTFISFFISVVVSPFQAIIIAKEDMKIYAYVGIYDVVIKLLIAYLLRFFYTDKLILYAILLLIASVSAQLIYFIFTISKYKEIKPKLEWDSSTIKSILGFSGWSFVGCLAFLCNDQGLNLLLNVFFGPIVNAAYNIGNSIKNAVNQLGSNFFNAVRPSLIKEYAANNLEYVRKLFLFSTKVIFCLLFMIMFPIMMETEVILSLWLGEVSDYMVAFVRLMLIWALLLSISEPITAIVQAANKVKTYHLKVDLFTLLSLPVAYVSFKLGSSPEWAFVISIIVLCVAHVIRLSIVRNLINVRILYYIINIVVRIFLAVCFSFILSCMVKFIFSLSSSVILLTRVIGEIITAIAISYMVVFSRDERAKINGVIKGFINKFSNQ